MSTVPAATPSPSSTVPVNNGASPGTERTTMPTLIAIRARPMRRSRPILPANQGEIGATSRVSASGILVSRERLRRRAETEEFLYYASGLKLNCQETP